MKRQSKNELDVQIIGLILARLMRDHKELGFFASEGPEWFFENWLDANRGSIPKVKEKVLLRLFINKLMRKRNVR